MKPSKINCFDIETSALPPEKLDLVKPEFKAPSNYKDADKIAANIAEQEASWREKAALDATTGQILCIGMSIDLSLDVTQAPEAETIERFWNWLELRLWAAETVIGFCVYNFDLPFLVRRSWVLGVEVPKMIRKGRYWHEGIIDLADIWKLGNFDQRVSLNVLARALGVGSKSINGAEFGRLWETDRPAAIAYVENDLTLTRLCAEKMLGIKPTDDDIRK